MPTHSTPVLLLPGYWHGSWCWSDVIRHLVASSGRTAVAVDMAGQGLHARRPRCLTQRPFNPAELATEESPIASVDLDQAANLLVSQIKQVGRDRPVTVVAHSAGGTVLTRATQQVPELVAHAVYLAATMPASDVPARTYFQMPENSGSLFALLLRADPVTIGALRLDPASNDVDYRQQLRDAFYGGVDGVVADAALALLTPDAPTRIGAQTTTLTRDGWGSVPRTYVTCAQDMLIRPALQHKFIADADRAFPDNPTAVVALDTSHSPNLSMPGHVADILSKLG